MTREEALKVMQEFNKPGADFSNPRHLEAYKVVYGRPHNLDPAYAAWAKANPVQNNVPQSGFREDSSRNSYYPGQKVADERAVANGTPTVSELLSIESLSFTPEWEESAAGYNSYDNAPMGFNPLFFAKEATAKQLEIGRASCRERV